MKNLFQAKALFAALVLSTAVHAADDKINVSVLNLLVGKIVQDVLKEHRADTNPVFKALELKLDEKETDLSSEDSIKAKLTFSATAEKTIWHAGDTKLALSLGGGADRKKSEAYLDIAASLETDTTSLARYAARELKAEYCSPTRPAPKGTEAIEKAVCAELLKLEKVTEVGPLFESLHQIAALQVQYSAVEIAETQAKLATTPDNQKQWVELTLARQKNNQDLAQQIANELKRASTGGASAKVSVKKLKMGNVAEINDFELYLDKNKIELSVRLTGTNVTTKELDGYFQMKPILEQEILSLQNNDPKSVAQVRSTLAWLVKGAKGFLTDLK